MFLLKEMKDPHSNAWLANFLEMDKRVLLSYHGTGCLDLERFSDWNCFFDELLEQPQDIVIVEIPSRGGGNCLSKDNPFREKEVNIQLCILLEFYIILTFFYSGSSIS
jgi:hypothetical protein